MGVLDKVPFLAGYNEQDQINRSRESQGLQTLGQMMTLQQQQQQMMNAPEDRLLKNRLINSQIGEHELKGVQAQLAQKKAAETQSMIEQWSALPDADPRKAMLQQRIRINIDPSNALDPAKSSNLPWYVQRGPDGKTTIDPAFAEYEKAKASAGAAKQSTPYFQFLPTPEGIVSGNARTGTLTRPTLDGAPVIKSQDSPSLQGQIAEAKKLGTDTGEQKAQLNIKESAVASIGEAKKMLEAGIYSGGWGPTQKNIAKYTPGVDTDKVVRTEAFISHIGNVVVPRLKEFGGNDSNEELKYLKGITGGDIALEPGTLKLILDSAEQKMARNIKRLSSPSGVPKNRPSAGGNVLRFDAQGNPI